MSDNKDFNNNSEYSTVTLSLDDGTELECAIIRTFPAGDKNYIALLPIADIDEEESEVYLYRFSLDSNNEPVLENIDSGMKNMKSYQMHLTKNLMLWNMKNSTNRKTLRTNNQHNGHLISNKS